MTRRIRGRLLVSLLVVIAACSGDDPADPAPAMTSTTAPTTTSTTTPPETSTTRAPTTTAAATTSTTTTTTTTPAREPFDGTFTIALDSGPQDWESMFIDPGAVVFHDGEFHMFYNGIDAYPAHVKVGYATSADGVSWTKEVSDPLFTTDRIPYATVSAFMSGAAVLDDGTWALYFYSVDNLNAAAGVIGRATAPSPTGPWTIDDTPVLDRGASGAWDSTGVTHPSIVRVGDEWWMYYDGNRGDSGSEGDRAIGLATSDDGATWTRHDDPATPDPPFDGGDPVFTVGDEGAWDGLRVYDPGVVRGDEGFVMTYLTRSPGTRAPQYDVGLAFSDDGVDWTRHSGNPVLRSTVLGFGGIFLSTLIENDAGYVFLFDAARAAAAGGGETVTYLKVHEGEIRPDR